MDTEDSFKTPGGALQRSRLHVRSGRRRLRQGKISSGILTLYDALLFAMEWYVKAPDMRVPVRAESGEDLRDDHVLYRVLVRSGALDGRFDYEAFDRLVEKASEEEMPGYDYAELLAGIESVMTQLGVMPFDEAVLPPEDPATF